MTRPQVSLYGDMSCDGVFDVSDAVLLARFIVQDKTAKVTDLGISNADVDGDGAVTTDDISRMLEKIGRMIDVFPAELKK